MSEFANTFRFPQGIDTEVIRGQVIAKANNYQAVPDKDGNRRIIKTDILRQYERNFIQQCRTYKGRGISSRFVLYILVVFRTAQSDLDNAIKTILDCLQYVGAIKDDNLCIGIVARKEICASNPRIEFAIQEQEQQLKLF